MSLQNIFLPCQIKDNGIQKYNTIQFNDSESFTEEKMVDFQPSNNEFNRVNKSNKFGISEKIRTSCYDSSPSSTNLKSKLVLPIIIRERGDITDMLNFNAKPMVTLNNDLIDSDFISRLVKFKNAKRVDNQGYITTIVLKISPTVTIFRRSFNHFL